MERAQRFVTDQRVEPWWVAGSGVTCSLAGGTSATVGDEGGTERPPGRKILMMKRQKCSERADEGEESCRNDQEVGGGGAQGVEEVGLVGSGSGDVRTLEVVVVDLCPSAEGKKEGKGKRREQGKGQGQGQGPLRLYCQL